MSLLKVTCDPVEPIACPAMWTGETSAAPAARTEAATIAVRVVVERRARADSITVLLVTVRVAGDCTRTWQPLTRITCRWSGARRRAGRGGPRDDRALG